MLQKPTMRSTWLPPGLAGVAMLLLNLGLYTRLDTQQVRLTFTFPYSEDFAAQSGNPYDEFGGDWEIRDQALVQLSTGGYDLGTLIPLQIPPEQPYRFEATLRYMGGTMGGGLMFNAQQTTSRQKSHMVRFNVDADRLWLIYGYFDDGSNFIGQGSAPLDILPNDSAPHRMGVITAGDTFRLLMDGAIVAENVPLQYFGGTVGFISAASQTTFDDVVVEPADGTPAVAEVTAAAPTVDATATVETTPEAPQAAPLEQVVFSETFDPNGPGASLWVPVNGDWQYLDGQYVQQQTDGFDLLSIYQQPMFTPMTIEVTFRHLSGTGGGLMFNLPTASAKQGGHMVRYFEDGSVVAWGYFDDADVFIGQGSTPVDLPQQSSHTLSVTLQEAGYTVRLDGAELVANVPLNTPRESSYVGLSASQSSVAFQKVQVLSQSNSAAATINAAEATGNWSVDGRIITQSNPDLTDFIAGTGVAAERFTISVDILLPPDLPEAGAGLIFHMEGRNDQRLGQMVRFGGGGAEIFWGYYDDSRTFVGQGSVPLTLGSDVAHTLRLVVRESTFDIRVDDTVVASALPIERGSGWIGLFSFGGPVTFTNVQLVLGE